MRVTGHRSGIFKSLIKKKTRNFFILDFHQSHFSLSVTFGDSILPLRSLSLTFWVNARHTHTTFTPFAHHSQKPEVSLWRKLGQQKERIDSYVCCSMWSQHFSVQADEASNHIKYSLKERYCLPHKGLINITAYGEPDPSYWRLPPDPSRATKIQSAKITNQKQQLKLCTYIHFPTLNFFSVITLNLNHLNSLQDTYLLGDFNEHH